MDTEKRLAAEEGKTKELREEVGRGRKALEGVRIAAGVRSTGAACIGDPTDGRAARDEEGTNQAR